MNRKIVLNILIAVMILTVLPFITFLVISYATNPIPIVMFYLGLIGLGVLLARWYGSDPYNTPKFYRYQPRKRLCPHCKYPYSSVRNQFCMNCGGSLVVENSPS
ncbi:MAG: hypothetical protein ACW98Y_08175 [Candidatus Thorarchaeota archaeon]